MQDRAGVRLLRRARNWTRRRGDLATRGYVRGMLSLIVPIYNVERYLDECLTSLRQQQYGAIEIIVVDDGSPDRSVDIAQRHRSEDRRVRIVTRPNGGLSAARNTGVAAARGEYFAFVDGDDTVTEDGYRHAMESLQATGSDFAVLPYQRITRSRLTPPAPWIQEVHRVDRLRLRLPDFPQILCNAVACSKVFRTSFWRETDLHFAEGIVYEDQQLTAEAYARASAFDVLQPMLYNWRLRDDGTSISQAMQTDEGAVRSLHAQLDAMLQSQQVLVRFSTPEIARLRLVQLLANDLHHFIRRVPFNGDDYWRVLVERVPDVVAQLPPDYFEGQVPARQKALYARIAADDRAGAVALVEYRDLDVDVERVGDALLASHPVFGPEGSRSFRLADPETRLVAGIMQVRPGVESVTLIGWAVVENLDLATNDHDVRAWAVGADGERLELVADAFTAEWLDEVRAGGTPRCDYRRGGLRIDIDLRAVPTGEWTIEVQLVSGALVRTAPVQRRARWSSATFPITLAAGPGRTAVLRVDRGRPLTLSVTDAPVAPASPGGPPTAQVASVALTPRGLRVGLDAEEQMRAAGGLTTALRSSSLEVEGALESDASGHSLLLPLTHVALDGVVRPLPQGRYVLDVGLPGEETRPLSVDPALIAELPVDELVTTPEGLPMRVVVRAQSPGPRLILAVHVLPPLRPEERGRRNEARLRALANDGSGSEPAAFFRSLYGEVTTDSARELHRELRRRGSPLRLVWSIADHSVPVPEGGEGLVEGTEDWHRALGAASHVVVNMHQPGWFRRPARQRMLETFHGYPYKRMGQTHWRERNLPAPEVASYLERAREWTHLLSPSSYATPLLVREFFPAGSTGEVTVLEMGYPRNDPLLAEDAAAVRERVRRTLGLTPDTFVVLYGPTFRDALSVDGRTADREDFLQPDAFLEAIGRDAHLLMRGHAFHARGRHTAEVGSRVTDVTTYPDVTELILASDAAILDYSSLRFDYALTRKPMVFLVPDVEEYHRHRPGLLPYDATAPGPHVATTAEAAALLADPEALRSSYAAAVEEFVSTYMELEDGHAAARVVDAFFDGGA